MQDKLYEYLDDAKAKDLKEIKNFLNIKNIPIIEIIDFINVGIYMMSHI